MLLSDRSQQNMQVLLPLPSRQPQGLMESSREWQQLSGTGGGHYNAEQSCCEMKVLEALFYSSSDYLQQRHRWRFSPTTHFKCWLDFLEWHFCHLPEQNLAAEMTMTRARSAQERLPKTACMGAPQPDQQKDQWRVWEALRNESCNCDNSKCGAQKAGSLSTPLSALGINWLQPGLASATLHTTFIHCSSCLIWYIAQMQSACTK